MDTYHPEEMVGITNLNRLIEQHESGIVTDQYLNIFNLHIESNKKQIVGNIVIPRDQYIDPNKNVLMTAIQYSSQVVNDINHIVTVEHNDSDTKYSFVYIDLANNTGSVLTKIDNLCSHNETAYGMGIFDGNKYKPNNEFILLIVTAETLQGLPEINIRLSKIPVTKIDKLIYRLVNADCDFGCDCSCED